MNHQKRFFIRSVSLILVLTLQFVTLQMSVSAQENTLKTGSIILTESGSSIETQKTNSSSTGEIVETLSNGKKNEEEKNTFKRQWSDDEIIKLGYLPDQIVIKFKEDKISLKKYADKQKVKDFITRESFSVSEKAMQKVRNKEAELGKKFELILNV